MTTQNTKTPAALAAAYLAECERKALDSRAELIEAQRRCSATATARCSAGPAGNCADLIARAAAADAVNGTRTAEILAARIEQQKAGADAASAKRQEAEAEAKAASEKHALAETYVRAAREAFEEAVQAQARQLAAEAVERYGTALNALLAAHEDYVVAKAAATPGGGLPAGQLLPAIPTFGAKVASAFTSIDNGNVYFPPLPPSFQDRAAALRAQIIAGQK